MAGVVTVTTDFGHKDSYAGALKGALLSVNPQAVIVDICNDISPGNIKEAAFVISGAYACYPAGTVHLGVVDPGVGSDRGALIVETEKYLFVGPDNGLFSLALTDENIVKRINIMESRYFSGSVSSTFHGRDLFAPVAAHLSLGVKPEAFGPVVDSIVTLESLGAVFSEARLSGSVIHIDTFGNIITSIRTQEIGRYFKGVEPTGFIVNTGKVEIAGLCETYSDRGSGESVALIGSSGYLEVGLNSGSAAASFGIGVGAEVVISVKEERGE